MRVLVIGDECTDVYVYGSCKRLCPSAPVPVFVPSCQKENKGMAGNVYQNIISLGDDLVIMKYLLVIITINLVITMKKKNMEMCNLVRRYSLHRKVLGARSRQ